MAAERRARAPGPFFLPYDGADHGFDPVDRFPVADLAGLIGSTGWGLWIAALGVTILMRPIHHPITPPATIDDIPLAGTPTRTRPAEVGLRN